MYINTTTVALDYYGTSFIKCPTFSKILHIYIRSNMLMITYSSESYVNATSSQSNDPSYKTFLFKVLKGIYQSNTVIMDGFEYFQTIKKEDDDVVEHYHVFIQDIKSLAEQRDSKIGEVMNQDF